MSTVIYYVCRAPHHLAAPSRYGIGGILFRHGTAAYCDGLGVDAQHHWVSTGGVVLDSLIRVPSDTTRRQDPDEDVRPRAGYATDESRGARPLTLHP